MPVEKCCGTCQRSYANDSAVMVRLGCWADHHRPTFLMPHDGKNCRDYLAKGEPFQPVKPKDCICTAMYVAGAGTWACETHGQRRADPLALAAIVRISRESHRDAAGIPPNRLARGLQDHIDGHDTAEVTTGAAPRCNVTMPVSAAEWLAEHDRAHASGFRIDITACQAANLLRAYGVSLAVDMRAEFWKWVDECGCDTDGAWSAWQACWNLLNPAKRPQNPADTEGG